MGNFEKLVVLVVLFLSAVVLAVSLTQEDEEGDSNPLSAGAREEAAAKPGADRGAGTVTTLASKPQPAPARPALSSEVNGGRPIEASAPARDASRTEGGKRVLRLSAGLEPSPLEDYMVYTCADGDTWAALADRFYGDRKMVSLLRAANDDLASPVGGDAILVPIYDFRREGSRPRATPAPRRTASDESAPAKPTAPLVVDGWYVVQNGDNLSRIAEKVYGKASRWREIWDANRTRLEDPDWLTVGTKLRIP